MNVKAEAYQKYNQGRRDRPAVPCDPELVRALASPWRRDQVNRLHRKPAMHPDEQELPVTSPRWRRKCRRFRDALGDALAEC